METSTGAAILAFVALGANFLGMALLVMFNPRSAAVRWYAAFVLSQLLWLALQGTLSLVGLSAFWWRVYGLDVHFMPALFTSAAIVDHGRTPRWLRFLPLGLALLVLPLMNGSPVDAPLTLVWQGAAWGAPAILYYARHRRSRAARAASPLGVLLTFLVPVGVVGAIALGGDFVWYVLPVMTIVIQLLIFIGVVRHRYYDIEVRAARSGELAAGAAERDRLALLGELSATIAHEVRNPLTGIRSLTQRIADESLDVERRQRYAGVILGEIGRLDRIVGNLNDLAKRTGGNAADGTGPTELRPLFEDLALLLETRSRRAGVRLTLRPDAPHAHAAREPLAQALLNVLLNAIAHSPPNGAVELGAVAADGRITVRVRDQGPGVPPEQREQIFDAFYTAAGGSGLGLAVVRRIVQEQGWQIEVADAPGGGAEFRIHIPTESN